MHNFWFLVIIEIVLVAVINWIVFKIKSKLQASGFKVTMLYGHTLDILYYIISAVKSKEYKNLLLPASYFLLVGLFVYIAILLLRVR